MKEQLSALIDGEFDIDNAEHLLVVAKSDGELKQSWINYHLIGDVMRGDDLHNSQMTKRIMDMLDNEPTILAPASIDPVNSQSKLKPHNKTFFARPYVWSIAASVAAVVFVGLVLLQDQQASQEALQPIEIADNIPSEYLTAHQTFAPSGSAYYIQNDIQNASYAGQ
jgi:sigma-E factor negative regulatory protein RseA